MITFSTDLPHIVDIMDHRAASGVATGTIAERQAEIDRALCVVTARDSASGLILGMGFITGELPNIQLNKVLVNRDYRGQNIGAKIGWGVFRVALESTK